MSNVIKIGELYTFTDDKTGDGSIIEGGFFLGSSLSFDELSVDTLDFSVRYFGEDNLNECDYGIPITYYKDDVLFGKFYLDEITQTGASIYEFSCTSAMGLLDNTYHYGGIYSGVLASDLIKDVIGDKIKYSYRQIFEKIKLYGWLPVDTRRENLKQILFACGGCIKKDSNGDVYITVLENETPKNIEANKLSNGSITFNKKATQVDVTEHTFTKLDSTEEETIFEGEATGQNFITPKGHSVRNASIITFDEPYHSITVEGANILNEEVDANYIVISSGTSVVIKGKPYVHSKNVIYRFNKDVSKNNGENIVPVNEKATLVSLSNSSSVGARTLAYHGYSNTVGQGIYLDNEKTGDMIQFVNPWGKNVKGFIKELDGTIGNTETYADAVIISDYSPITVQPSHTLVSIAVTTMPNRLAYEAGEYFDYSGMVVTATYDDGLTNIVDNYTFEPYRPLTVNDNEITIKYRELGVTATTSLSIEVKLILKSIAITTPPYTTVYAEGEIFNPDGMVVKAYYSDGTNREINNYTYSPTGQLSEGIDNIEVSYTEDGITKLAYQAIAVDSTLVPESIEVIKMPNKVKYKEGEYFDSTGMVCKVTYSGGVVNQNVLGYYYSPTGVLTQNDTNISISYTYNNVTVSTSIPITVVILTGIQVTTQPNKTSYYEDEYFDPLGMVVTAYYSDGTNVAVTNYTYEPTRPLIYGETTVTISFTDGTITKTTTISITVNYYNYDFTNSIVIDSNRTFTLSDIGATHKNIRIVCVGGGEGGDGGTAGTKGTDGTACSASNGSSATGSAGTGGEGGEGGEGGSPGKVYATDYYTGSLTAPITVNLGSGGEGGDGGTSNTVDGGDKVAPGTGSLGTATTVTVNGDTFSSENGNISSTGFTDIFTSIIYALPGILGLSGVAGGNGGKGITFNEGEAGSSGENAGSNTGGAGGNGTYSTGGQAVSRWTENEGKPQPTHWNIGSTVSGYKTKSFDRNTGNWNLSNYVSYTVKASSNQSVYNMSGSTCVRSLVGTTSVSGDTRVPGYKVTYTKQANYTVGWGKGYGGGGGGGAAYNNNGNSGSSSTGGAGAEGSPKPIPATYGSGGDGGNGGGGGGGGGGTSIDTHNNFSSTVSTVAPAGGLGGPGSKGGNGAKGCVIIYFS